MTYPQTSAEKATLLGQGYWRLFTELESSGDIFEAIVSARAVVIGPESDISRVNLTYYDEQSPNLASPVIVSVDKPLVGRVDALFSTPYQSGDRARVLISTEDLLPPTGYTPLGFIPPNDTLEIVQPSIDLYYYLNEEPEYIEPRSDRVHLFEQLPVTFIAGVAFDVWYVIPFYGRRFAEVTFKNLGIVGAVNVTGTVYGVNFSNIVTDASLADNGHQQEQLGQVITGVPALGVGITDSVTIVDRSFDALVIRISPAAAYTTDFYPLTTHIVVSDKV